MKSILEGERESKLFDDGSEYGVNVFQKAAGTWLIPFFQDEVNFEAITAFEMLNSHFRGIASATL